MTTECDFSGRCAMHTSFSSALRTSIWVLAACLGIVGPFAHATEAPPSVPMESPAEPAPVPIEAEAPYQVATPAGNERQFDEALFTEISPVSVPEVGIRLPSDQED